MGKRRWRILGIFLVAGLVLHSCGGSRSMGGRSLKASILYQGVDCGLCNDAPLGAWIGSPSDLLLLDAEQGRLCEEGRILLQNVDFEKDGVLLMGLGTRNTEGYDIRLASSNLEIRDDTAIIRLYLQRADPENQVPRALGRPCVLIRLPKSDYHHVQTVDEAGRLVMKTRIH